MNTAVDLVPSIPAHFDEGQRAVIAHDTDKGGLCVTDEQGRFLVVRRLDILEQMDLIETAGEPAGNEQWLMVARAAASVRSIDGVPVPRSGTISHVRAAIRWVGTDGILAVINALPPEEDIAASCRSAGQRWRRKAPFPFPPAVHR